MNRLDEFIKKLRTRDPKVTITLNQERSAIAIVRGNLATPVNVTELRKAPHKYARRFIEENKLIVGDIDVAKALVAGRAITNRRGMTHVVFHQKYGEALVLGGDLSVHYGMDGVVYLVNSTLASGIDVPKKPKILATRAVEVAKKHAGAGASLYKKMKPILIVVDAKTLHQEEKSQRYYLCWQMRIVPPKNSREPDMIYFVDALNGEVLLRYSALQTVGTGYYSVGSTLNSQAAGGTFRLLDTVTSAAWPEAIRPAIHTYDDANSGSLGLRNYSEDLDDNWDNGGVIPANRFDDQRAEVDLHRFLSYVLNYYYLTHGHNSWDSAGADMRGHAHNHYFPYMPNNAFWDSGGHEMYFGDGNGTTYDFFTALSVTGHEFTHGVINGFNILQTYDGETGAANEALADLFGCFIAQLHPADDPWPWQHGRQYRLDGTVGRNMIDPSRDAAGIVQYDATSDAMKYASYQNGFYPDHYSIRYTGTMDYHGVHINSLIISHAIYLMVNGGTHRLSSVTVPGIGVAPVEQMLYEAISTILLNNNSDFADLRLAFIEACQTLYPDNLDYLATVKTAFHAVGIGPDLYIRDQLIDQGVEPGTLSCMSPDIIVRRQQADTATLTLISDLNNASLCEDIELGVAPHDHYVYFRIFNRGSMPASGTLRLFISPVSTFPTPGTWHEVGHYDFPNVPIAGGTWIPTAADQCITLSATLINDLGIGHYCFIGVIESNDDPAPDWMLIDNVSEFHSFISKSNNYAWRNCNIVSDITPGESGEFDAIKRNFQINGFGRKNYPRDLEIDTRDLPEGTQLILWIPETKFYGLKAFEVRTIPGKLRVAKIAGTLEDLPAGKIPVRVVPMSELTEIRHIDTVILRKMEAKELSKWRPLHVSPVKVVRLAGLTTGENDKIDIRFIVKFPKNIGTHDVTLAFRELGKDGLLGQMNYIFKIRKPRK
jgi:Zn-dependent metalloprotease